VGDWSGVGPLSLAVGRGALAGRVALGVNPDGLLVAFDQHVTLLEIERTTSGTAKAVGSRVQVKVRC
jgi:hypothetical protein